MAYLEITLTIDDVDRTAAAAVYTQYKQPFLDEIAGARSKDLLVRDEDVQVLHGFDTADDAKAYLSSDLFTRDVVDATEPEGVNAVVSVWAGTSDRSRRSGS